MSALRDRLVFAGIGAAGVAGALVLVRPRPPLPADADDARETAETEPVPSATVTASAAPPPPPPPPAYVRESPDAAAACGGEMLLVDGIYCPFVGHTCARFADEPRDICATFGPDVLCEGRLVHRRYCVDRFEYPNLAGVVPVVLVTFEDAQRACAVEGKRLCTAEEWEFACEGTSMWPYPNGRERDAKACNLDGPAPDERAVAALLASPHELVRGLEAVDKRAASGAFAGCVSPFGVRDTSGNVAEWVVNEAGKNHEAPFRSALKGGSWVPSRAACRPIVTSHDAAFRAVDVGFRCCKDARGSPRAAEPAPSARLPKKSRMP